MSRIALVLAALALLLPQGASAAFKPTTPPFAAGTQLDDFDANDSRWIATARPGGAPQIAVSDDLGASWSAVADPAGSPYVDVSAAPDGSVWLSATKTAETDAGGLLHRLAPGSLTPAPVTYSGFGLGGGEDSGYTYASSAPVWDASGHAWVAVTVTTGAGASRHLVRLGSDGGPVAHRIALASEYDVSLDRLGTQVYVLGSDYLRLDGTALTPVAAVPEWLDGERSVDGAGRRSYDGGASYHGGTYDSVRAVQNAPGLAIAGPSVLRSNLDGLSPTGLADAPEGWLDAVGTEDGIAVPGQDGLVHFHAGAVPPAPPAAGAQISRVNVLRAAAGLAPVREDARLTQASAAHVNYWSLNGFSAHDEISGFPGFTGATASQRCLAAGYPSGCSEVSFPERTQWAVDGWIATPYHGRPLVDPDATDLGGAELAGVGANINAGPSRAIRFTPAPFPLGSYDGDLVIHGESPDPVIACLESGQDVEWPLGSTVFLSPPTGGTASVTGLARAADGAALAGCRLEGMFLPDEPLAPHTTYRATGVWSGTDDGASRPIEWEFTTGAGHDTGGTGTTTTTTTTTTTITRPGGSGLRYGIAKMRRPRLAAFARRGLRIAVTCEPACRASAKLTARLGRRTVTLGRSRLSAQSGTPKLRVGVARKLRKRVRRQRRLAVHIHLTVDANGLRPPPLRHRITLRR